MTKKDYRKRYERIGKSEWFKKAYENKSLGETIEITDEALTNVFSEIPGGKITDEDLKIVFSAFAKNLEDNQKDIPGEIQELVNDNFWDLIGEQIDYD